LQKILLFSNFGLFGNENLRLENSQSSSGFSSDLRPQVPRFLGLQTRPTNLLPCPVCPQGAGSTILDVADKTFMVQQRFGDECL